MSQYYQQDDAMTGAQWVAGSIPTPLFGANQPVRVEPDAAPQTPTPQRSARRTQRPIDLWADPDALDAMAQRARESGDRLAGAMFAAAQQSAAAVQRPVTLRGAADRFLRHRPGTPNRAEVKTRDLTQAIAQKQPLEGYTARREPNMNLWRLGWTCTTLALVAAIGYLFISGLFMLPAAMQRLSPPAAQLADAQPAVPGPPPPDVSQAAPAQTDLVAELPAPMIPPAPVEPSAEPTESPSWANDVMALAGVLAPPPSERDFWEGASTMPVRNAAAEPVEPRPVAEALPPEPIEPVEPIIATEEQMVTVEPYVDEPSEPIVVDEEFALAPPPASDDTVVFAPPTLVDATGAPLGAAPGPFESPQTIEAAVAADPRVDTATRETIAAVASMGLHRLWTPAQQPKAVEVEPVKPAPEPEPTFTPPPADDAVVFVMPEPVDPMKADKEPQPAPVVAEAPKVEPKPQPVVAEAPKPAVVEEAPAAADDDIPTLTLRGAEPADEGPARYAPGVAEWINSPDGPWQSQLWEDRPAKPQPEPAQTPIDPQRAAAILDRVFRPIHKALEPRD